MIRILLTLLALAMPAAAESTFPPGGGGSSSIAMGSTPISGGADKQILFNDGGVVQGNTGLTFDKSLGNVSAAGFFIGLSSWLNSNSTSSYLAFGTTQDVRVYRDGSSILAQRNGTNAQTFRAYGAFNGTCNGTTDACEWGTFDWATTPNTLTIGSKANGTGVAKPVGIDVGTVRAMTFDANGIFTAGRIGSGNGLTANDPFTIQQRMNGSGVAFTLAKLNFEDQASSATSQFLQLQQTGTVVAGFQKLPATSTNAGTIFYIGAAPGATQDPAISISRSVGTQGSGNAHGIGDTTSIGRGGTMAYASYDSQITFNAAFSYDHFAAFQSRPTYQQTGTITNHYGLYDSVTMNSAGAVLTNRYSVYVQDGAVGAGSITNQYGLYVSSLSAGSTANYGVVVAGNNPSLFGGVVSTLTTLVASLPGTAATGMVQGARAAVTNATTCVFGTAPTGGGSTFCPVVYNGSAWVGG